MGGPLRNAVSAGASCFGAVSAASTVGDLVDGNEVGADNCNIYDNGGGECAIDWDKSQAFVKEVMNKYGDAMKAAAEGDPKKKSPSTNSMYYAMQPTVVDNVKTPLLKLSGFPSDKNNINGPYKQSENTGINHWLGPTLILLGQPIDALKPVGALGSKTGSSIASKYLAKAMPSTFTKTLGKPMGQKIAKSVGTNVIGRAAGRFVPISGWSLTAYDIWDNRVMIRIFSDEIRKTNEKYAYKLDGTWNIEWHVH